MASTTSAAKILSSPPMVRPVPVPVPVPVPAPAPSPRGARWGWLQVLRESLGGALLLAAWIALWTVTWAAVAGPLSPVREAGPARAQVTSVEGS